MAFPKGYRLIGGLYYRTGDRSGPYIIDGNGNATLMNVGETGGGNGTTPALQRATPQDGGTVTVNQTDPVVTLLIEGAVPLNSLNIVLPQPGNSRPGQIVRIVSWVDIEAVSYGAATVGGVPAQMFSGDGIALQNIEDNNWLRLP